MDGVRFEDTTVLEAAIGHHPLLALALFAFVGAVVLAGAWLIGVIYGHKEDGQP